MYEAIKINKEWRIRSLSPCFKPILISETYKTKAQAVRAAKNADKYADATMTRYLADLAEFKERFNIAQ